MGEGQARAGTFTALQRGGSLGVTTGAVPPIPLLAMSLLPADYRVVGATSGFPFLVIAVIAAARQWRLPSAVRVLRTESTYSTPHEKRNIERVYHLDEPLWQQYVRYLGGVLQGDFGPSYRTKDFTVSELLIKGAPASFKVGGLAVVLAVALAMALPAAPWVRPPP